MRQFIRDFCKVTEQTLDLVPPIVEIGSYQVPGQEELANLRPLFPSKEYIGCDMRSGPGVDRVENLPMLSFADHSLSTIICLDTLEHVYDIRESIAEFHRVLKDDGVLVLSSVFNFPIHGHPYDYWRFTPHCFERLLEKFPCRLIGASGEPRTPHTVYGVAFNGRNADEMHEWRASFEHQLLAVMKENLETDVKGYIPRRVGRRGLRHAIPRYPFYCWSRVRYRRERERFYRLELSFAKEPSS